MRLRRTLEMSIAREDFFRLLRRAMGPFDVEGETFRSSGQGPRWTIRPVPLGDRRLGSVAVPRHRVEIVVEACSQEEAEAFMTRFHRAFLRGGG